MKREDIEYILISTLHTTLHHAYDTLHYIKHCTALIIFSLANCPPFTAIPPDCLRWIEEKVDRNFRPRIFHDMFLPSKEFTSVICIFSSKEFTSVMCIFSESQEDLGEEQYTRQEPSAWNLNSNLQEIWIQKFKKSAPRVNKPGCQYIQTHASNK